MTSLDLGTLHLKLDADIAPLEKGLSQAKTSAEKTKQSIDRLGKTKVELAPGAEKGLDKAARSADGLGKGLGKAAREAKGLRIPPQVGAELDKAASSAGRLSDGIGGVAKKLAGFAGLAAGVGSVGAAFGQSVKLGNEFQSNLNTLNAVAQASGSQLAAVSAKARELGSDTSLTATSASDAAAAMTELAKGGFTVEQSMEAAKGTLQLAAAAQIGAADAATIQSQALQSFGLGAEHAARVSDILAGAANASSAEMTGVAQGLQQAGTVSRQFGLTIDDTATALAMFANAGIQGSDAGTLLKTALLALTDQGKPAQQAMHDLGLTVYNAKGEFVGLPTLFEQLADAQKRMTPEAYQAASATLFGSDAMRLAGIGAMQGREGFEKLREAVTRQGQAAEVAAAQTAGLPGALERLNNATEEAALGVFEVIQGPLTAGADHLVNTLERVGPALSGGLQMGINSISGLAGALSPVTDQVGKLVKVAEGAPGPFIAMAGALALNKWAGVSDKLASVSDAIKKTKLAAQESGKSINSFGAAFSTLRQHSTVVDGMAGAYSRASAPLNRIAADHMKAAAAAKAHALAEKDVFRSIDLLGQQAGHSMAAGAAKMTGAARGMVAGGFNLIKQGAAGVIGMLGGPWGIAMMAGAAAIGVIVDAVHSYRQALENIKEKAREARDAQDELNASLAGTSGALQGDALDAAGKIADNALAPMIETGKALDKWYLAAVKVSGIAGFVGMSLGEVGTEAGRTVKAYKALNNAINDLGMDQEQVGKIVAEGGEDYKRLSETLNSMGSDGKKAAKALAMSRAEVQASVSAARELSPAYGELSSALDVLADKSSNAGQKVAALEQAMQALGMAPKSAEEAMMHAAEVTEELVEKQRQALDQSKGFGDSLFGDNGALRADSANARELSKQLTTMRTELQNVSASGGDTGKAFEGMAPVLDAMAERFGLTADEMSRLATEYGLIPKTMDFMVAMEGASEVTKQLAQLSLEIGKVPTNTPIRFPFQGDEAMKQLKQLGFEVEHVAGDKNMTVTAKTEDAHRKLQDVSVVMAGLEGTEVPVEVKLDTTPVSNSAAILDQLLRSIDGKEVSAQANLIIDKLKQGVDISRGELAVLSNEKAIPTADLEKALLDAGVQDAHGLIDGLNGSVAKTSATMDASNVKNEVSNVERILSAMTAPVRMIRVGVQRIGNWVGLGNNAAGGLAGLDGLPRHSEGGRLPTTGPGTNTTDGLLGVGSDGVPTTWVDAGEFVTRRSRTERFLPMLYALNEGSEEQIKKQALSLLGGLAAGGVAGATQNVISKIQYMDGTPYIMGGWSTAGTDCSGAVSMAANAAVGLDPMESRMTTVTQGQWLAAKGFKDGRGKPGDMVVGWYDYGGGANGHTAAQLFDGTYVESGGNTGGGLTIGRGAGPLDGRGFTNFMHLPLEDAVGGGGEGDEGAPVGMGTVVSGSAGGVSAGSGGTRSSGGSAGGSGGVSRPQVSISDGSMSVFQAGQRMGIGGGLGALALVNEDTVSAFNALEQAREDEKKAVEAIVEAEKRLAEARANTAGGGEDVRKAEEALAKARDKAIGVDGVDELVEKEKALAEAREGGDPEAVARAEQALSEARKNAPKGAKAAASRIVEAEKKLSDARANSADGAGDSAKAVEEAEANLRNAREASVAATNRAASADRKYKAELAQAPFKAAESIIGAFGGIFSAMGSMYQAMADAERKKLDQAKEALSVWQRQIDAQKAVQDATEASTQAMREQVKARWQSDLAVSDAEWELTMHRKRSQKELAEAVLFGINVTEMKAKTERRTAVLEAQIAFEKAQRDLTAFLRDKQLADSAFEMERSHKLAAIQTSRLALVAGALAKIQGALNIEEMKALEIKAIKAQGMATSANGLGGIVGGIGGIIGALGMAAVNPLGALAAGAAAIGGIISGAGQMKAGRAQMKAAEEQQRALQNVGKGDPKFIQGLDGKSLEALDLQEQQLEIQMSQDRLQRQKDAAKQHDLLQQLVDNAEKNLEYAKRDEKRADDLASLWDDNKSMNATAFFQFGGSGWAGGAKQFTGATGGGFGGLREARLSPESSMVVENGAQKAARLGLPSAPVTSPENVTASTSLLNLRETKAMRVTMDDLLGLVERIESVVANGGVQDNVGAVFNGDVTLVNHDAGNADNRALAAALARKG